MSEESIEVDRHAAQFAGMIESEILEVLAKIPRFRRWADPPHHRNPFREKVGEHGIDRGLRILFRDSRPEDPIQQFVREPRLHAQHVGSRVDRRPRHPPVGAVKLAQVRFDRDHDVAREGFLDAAYGLAPLPDQTPGI